MLRWYILKGNRKHQKRIPSLGYPSDVINKTIDNTMLKLNRTVEHGPKKFPVYLKLPYLGKQATFLENKVKDTVNNTFGAVNLII